MSPEELRSASLHAALFTTSPDEPGGVAEVCGGSYARAALDPATVVWASDGRTTTLTNGSRIDFGPATAAWGRVTHGGVFDGGGKLLVRGALDRPYDVASGAALSFAPSHFRAQVDN